MKCATVGGITPCCLVSVGSEWKSKIILNYCCIGCLLPIFHLCQGSLSPVSSCCSATLMLWIASVPSSRDNQSKCNRHFLRRHANAITTWQSVNLQRPMLIRLMQAMLCQWNEMNSQFEHALVADKDPKMLWQLGAFGVLYCAVVILC